jgi:hypothetical protein
MTGVIAKYELPIELTLSLPKVSDYSQQQYHNFTTYCGNFNTKRKIGNLN